MPIITMQKRLRQAGRIRIGAKVATKTGGSRPGKLDAFRFTSPDRSAIDAVADAFGGEAQPWDGAAVGSQWEVFTKTTEFDIIVPPTDIAFSQWYELWSGGGCQRRCDGVTNILNDSPCACDSTDPACKPTTRLNVILAAIEGIGVWRLESHGWNAAAELSGGIEVLKAIQVRNGAMVPGKLMLEQRQSKSLDDKGKPQTFNYAVPVLDFKINVAEASQRPALPVTPIHSELPPVPSVADQVQAAATPQERPRRANAAAPLPSTGLKPRGLSTTPEVTQDANAITQPQMRRLMALLNGKGIGEDVRHGWASENLGRTVASFKDLTSEDAKRLMDVLEGKAVSVGAYTGNASGEEPF